MAKLKLDVKQLQNLLLGKAELIGLGFAGLLLVLFFGYAVLALLGLRSSAPEIDKDVKALKSKIEASQPTLMISAAGKLALGTPTWDHPIQNLQYASGHWFDGSNSASNKREKPLLLAMDKNSQVDYIRGGVRTYDVNREEKVLRAFKVEGKKKGEIPEGQVEEWKGFPVQQLRPTRMIVVSGTFPYKEQMAEYQKALRIPVVDDLFAKNLQPMFRGFNVYRARTLPGESLKDAKWEPLYTYVEKKGKKGEPDERVEAAEHIRNFLADAEFDRDNVTELAEYLTPNAATPLPKILTGGVPTTTTHYPPLKLPGIIPVRLTKADPTKKVVNPQSSFFVKKKANLDGGEKKVNFTDLNKEIELPKEILDQIADLFNVVSQHGVYVTPPLPGKEADLKVKPGEKQPEVKSGGYAFTKVPGEGKALIRFIDVDVQPGATYQYKIQLVFANPNYKLVSEVTHPDIAAPNFLLSDKGFHVTKAITIPDDEYRFYVFDQMSPEQDGKFSQQLLTTGLRKAESIDVKALPNDRAAIQIFKWVDKTTDVSNNPYLIGDWVVAERLLIGRGDKVGGGRGGNGKEFVTKYEVEVPWWNDKKNDFEVGEGFYNPKNKFLTIKAGVPIDFLLRRQPKDPQDLAPVVVDFEGGRNGGRQYKGDAQQDDKTNSPLEMLLLGPDGKLTMRNSFDDRDQRNSEGQAIYEAWQSRLNEVRRRQYTK